MPSTRRILSAIKRREAITGRRLTPAETRAIVEPAFTAEAGEATRRAALDITAETARETSRQGREALAIRKRAAEAEEEAAEVAGLVDVGTLALGTETGRKIVGGAIRKTGETISGAARAAAGETAPAVTDAGATIRETSTIPSTTAGGAVGATLAAPEAAVATEGGVGLTTGALEEAVVGGEVAGAEVGAAEAGVEAGVGLETVGATVVGGTTGGFVGQRLTKAGEPGHMGGERITGAVIGAGAGIGVTALMMTNPITAPIAIISGLIGAFGGSGEKVICTELHRQKYLSDETMKYDREFGLQNDLVIRIGYRKMADPIVVLMKKHKWFTWMVSLLAIPWAKQMASVMNPKLKGNLLGKVIMKVGLPLCRFIGNFYVYREVHKDVHKDVHREVV